MKNIPIYFVHGFRGSPENFILLKQYFPESTALALPGFSMAEKPDTKYDLDFYLRFLKKKITKKSILIGHSLGAYLIQEFALLYPELVEKVIVIGYPFNKKLVAYVKLDHYNQITLVKRPKLLTQIQEMVRPFIAQLVYWGARLVFSPYQSSIRDWVFVPNRVLTNVWNNTVVPSDCSRLEKLRSKAILINGDHDIYNYDRVSTFNSFGKSFVIKGMGHQFFRNEGKIAEIIKENLR